MKVKFSKKDILMGFIIPIGFMVLTITIGTIWYILLKYFDFLLGVLPDNLLLTFLVFCATIGAIIFGGSVYVSNRKM